MEYSVLEIEDNQPGAPQLELSFPPQLTLRKCLFLFVLLMSIWFGLGSMSVVTTRTARELYGGEWVAVNCTVLEKFGPSWEVCAVDMDCHYDRMHDMRYNSTEWNFCEFSGFLHMNWDFVVNVKSHEMIWPDVYHGKRTVTEFRFVQCLIVDYILLSIFWCVLVGKW